MKVEVAAPATARREEEEAGPRGSPAVSPSAGDALSDLRSEHDLAAESAPLGETMHRAEILEKWRSLTSTRSPPR